MLTVLHVIERLSGAGPTRSLLALGKYLAADGVAHRHRILALQRAAYPPALLLARQAGMTLLRAPDEATTRAEIAAADVVVLHYWQTPVLHDWLRRAWPPMRLLVWLKIAGRHAPQVLTPALLAYADATVATTPVTGGLPVVRAAAGDAGLAVVPGIADADRLRDIAPRPHAGFAVGYIGTLNATKMHPRFVAMSAAIRVPDLRVVVCGAGDPTGLRAEAEQLGAAGRFEWRGYVEAIGPVLAALDVFGYPLCADTYATSEKSLQEAMLAGVPPVVFPHGGVAHLVRDGETGLVVHDEAGYRDAIERLHRDPAQRARLGHAAREYARAAFDGRRAARTLAAQYEALGARPKRAREWTDPPPAPAAIALPPDDGARRFVAALGDAAPAFAASLRAAHPADWQAADARIAAASPLLAGGEGGLFHYRNHYPDAAYLRWWSALVLARQGRAAEAARERAAAIARGLPPARAAHTEAAAGAAAETP